MAFQPINMQAISIKDKINQPFLGTFIGKKMVNGDYGPQPIFDFVDADGVPFSIYGFTNLNRAMDYVKKGEFCRVTYKGLAKAVKTKKFGTKDIHQVLVEVDRDSGAPPVEIDPVAIPQVVNGNFESAPAYEGEDLSDPSEEGEDHGI